MIAKQVTKKNFLSRLGTVLLSVSVVSLITGGMVAAVSVASGYVSDDLSLSPGMMVAISEPTNSSDLSSNQDSNTKVERATLRYPERVIGVAVDSNDTLVTLASGTHNVYVQSTGDVDVYVNDLGGSITKDDRLSLSPLNGLLMKAGPQDKRYASALENSEDNVVETQEIPGGDNSGLKTVKISKIAVSLDGGYDNAPVQPVADSGLRRLGRAVVGRDVSDIQAVIAMVIFLAVLVSEGAIIYGAVSSGIISMGRNPLAKRQITAQLLRICGLALVVLIIGLTAMYIILII